MRFGGFYLEGRYTVYDLATEIVGGVPVHVATLSEQPSVRCVAATAESAVARLQQRLTQALSAPAPAWSRQAGAKVSHTTGR
jgi:hypothetical protein